MALSRSPKLAPAYRSQPFLLSLVLPSLLTLPLIVFVAGFSVPPFSVIELAHPAAVLADLQSGPIQGHGIIEKIEIKNSRYGIHGYISIQGGRYYVPDRKWLQTMAIGQEINFLSSETTKTLFPNQ